MITVGWNSIFYYFNIRMFGINFYKKQRISLDWNFCWKLNVFKLILHSSSLEFLGLKSMLKSTLRLR